MKLLFENWRQYLLTEVSFEDAKEILDSKRTMKIIKAYRYDNPRMARLDRSIQTQHRNFKNYLLDQIPDDLTDNQKGTSVLWLLRLSRENPGIAFDFINGRTHVFRNVWNDLETFFHHQRFMPQQDLMSIKSIEDLTQMAEGAKEEINKAQEKKQYLDAEVGTEVLRDDDEWFIAAIHNKGAACELGKGTNWCTAAPGLDYFEDYYKPDDPLFYFEGSPNRNDLAEPAAEKYQFHYGSEQFMDKDDSHVSEEIEKWLHNILMQTEAPKKYPVVQNYYYEILAEDRETPPEELAALAENPDVHEGILTKVANNPSTPLETLEQLAKSDNKFIKRAIQVNAALDMGLAIELFVNNPKDELMYSRGIRDMYDFVTDGKLDDEQANQIIDSVVTKRGYNEPLRSRIGQLDLRGHKPQADPTEVANLGRIYEHKFRIRIIR